VAEPKAWTIPRPYQRLGRPAISLATFRRRVREVAGWRRPRLVAKGDPGREAVLTSLHQRLSELPEDAVVLAEDETHLHLLPWVRATWIAKGARQPVMTPGTNRRRSILGAVDLATGRCFDQVAAKAVSATFTAFCAHLLAAYPTAPVVAVTCDNVIIHCPKIVQRWLQTHPRLRILHGARDGPHDTPIGWTWGALKTYLANSPTLTIQGRIRQVHARFHQRTPSNCWPPPRRTAPRGCPTVTCNAMSRPRQPWGRPPNCQSWISTLAYSPACTQGAPASMASTAARSRS
jgi:hypothetical protein